ncbi:hypothetical protein HXX01_02250 [Candidatus Nomurabacteria bacterium]|nr:hypothetical protein [Candidatus Nomurabacteria bacterium]
MEPKTKDALYWIIGILDKHQIPYRIGGGFAAHFYGSDRPINDIDISLSGEYFPVIIKEVSEYITAGPKHYINEKWDCDTLSINYGGQRIDMTDIDTLRMSNKEKTEWHQTKDKYRNFPNIMTNIEGIEVSLMDPRDLVAYKKELADENHLYQLIDIEAVEKYIKENNIV